MSIFPVAAVILFQCSSDKAHTSGFESRSPVTSPPSSEFYGRDYFIDDQHSYIGFRITYFGTSNVRGRFDRFKGTAFYDSSSHFLSAEIIINASSINTGVKMRDDDIKGESWLSTQRFPVITFKSSAVAVGTDGFDLTGELYLKGKKKTITARFAKPTRITKDWAGNDQVDFTGEFEVTRSEFGIAAGGKWDKIMENGFAQLSDGIKIELEIHARRADYARRKKMLSRIDSMANILMNKISERGFEAGVKMIGELRAAGKEQVGDFTLLTVANILIQEKKYEQAIILLKIKSGFYPDEKDGLNPLAVCYLLKGDVEKARETFREVLNKDSTNTKALEYLRLLN